MKTIATLTPPQGWKLLSDSERQSFIRKTFGDIDDIIAVAFPEHGDRSSVFALLSFRNIGYVSDKTAIDAKMVQQRITDEYNMLNHEQGFGSEDAVHWKRFAPMPLYNPEKHCLEYGIELLFGKKPALNLYKILLLRNGAAVLTVVGSPSDRLNLRDWIITADKNLAYEAFNPAQDQRCEGNLNNLMLMNQFV